MARCLHSMVAVLLFGFTLPNAACVIPPPLELDQPDASPNSPPVITSIRGENAVEYQDQGVVTAIRGQGSFTATLLDTDLEDTLYVRVFVDWTPTNTEGPRALCSAAPLSPATVLRTTTCDLSGVCPEGTDHTMIVEVYDREVIDTGQPLHRVTSGLSSNRSFQLSCSEAPL